MNEIQTKTEKRTPNQREKILYKLRKAGKKGVLNTELIKDCIGVGSRISELYRLGYKIECQHLSNGVCKYILLEEPELETPFPKKALDVLLGIMDTKGGAISKDELLDILKENNFNIVRKHGNFK